MQNWVQARILLHKTSLFAGGDGQLNLVLLFEAAEGVRELEVHVFFGDVSIFHGRAVLLLQHGDDGLTRFGADAPAVERVFGVLEPHVVDL